MVVEWGEKIKDWFTENVSYDKFYEIATNIIDGFLKGIKDFYFTCQDTILGWGSDIINWFTGVLDIASPSKVFYDLAGFVVKGFNSGFSYFGKTSEQTVSDWANSIASVNPTVKLGIDTSELRYYESDSFAKNISKNAVSTTSATATGFEESFQEFYQNYIEPTLSQMAEDMRRQADKNEQTIVQIGNRTVSDAVTTQRKANGYAFVK